MYTADPVIRMRRLKSDYASMVELARASNLISFQSRGTPADRYLVTFRCKGTIKQGNQVTTSTRHVIEIILHATYPATAPKFHLRTPLYHPNFKFGDPNLQVCIEAKNWVPSESLESLVLRLGNMITYRNYNPTNPLDGDAARWAMEHKHLFPLDDRAWYASADDVVIIDDDDGPDDTSPDDTSPDDTPPDGTPADTVEEYDDDGDDGGAKAADDDDDTLESVPSADDGD